ncbi:hypothetical protein GCM10023144_14800 [Pigmentiphaga soli]|uniref:FimV N-terminal domain-containing protein n=1 Tax=Pigmentiphaga soli TaxID=1007095 RepID=A0ABP8GR56_9BURK
MQSNIRPASGARAPIVPAAPRTALAGWLAAGAGLALAAAAQGAELGSLRVLSASGEPLRAEIEITELAPGEAASLSARLADREVYRRTGLEYGDTLSGLTVDVHDNAAGRKVVGIASSTPPASPVLDLLVELGSRSGRFIRQYSFVLDARAGAAAPAAEPLKVAPGDTLFGIARRIRPPEASMPQTLAALLQANPQAFIGGNMNRLRAGALLSMPTPAQIGAVDQAAAARLFAEQAAAYDAFRQRVAGTAGDAGAAGARAGRPDGGRIGAGAGNSQPEAPAADTLRLSSGGEPGTRDGGAEAASDRRQEERDATRKAIAESESRVNELQRNVDSMQGMLSVPNAAMAAAQQAAGGNSAVDAAAAGGDGAPAGNGPAAAEGGITVASADGSTAPNALVGAPADEASRPGLSDRAIRTLAAVVGALGALLVLLAWRRRSTARRTATAGAAAEPAAGADDDPFSGWEALPTLASSAAAAAAAAAYAGNGKAGEADDGEADEGDAPARRAPAKPVALDFDLDLDGPAEPAAAPAAARPGIELDTDVIRPDAGAQLATARAFIEMGDRDGARELFETVLRSGTDEQRRQAREALAAL